MLPKIVGFISTLFVTGTLYSHLSVQKVWKHGIKGAEAVDLTFGDQIVHLFSRLSGLP